MHKRARLPQPREFYAILCHFFQYKNRILREILASFLYNFFSDFACSFNFYGAFFNHRSLGFAMEQEENIIFIFIL